MTPAEAEGLILEALAEPLGLLLRTSDPERTKQALYRAKTRLGSMASELQIRTWPRTEEADLALVRRRVELRRGSTSAEGSTSADETN